MRLVDFLVFYINSTCNSNIWLTLFYYVNHIELFDSHDISNNNLVNTS